VTYKFGEPFNPAREVCGLYVPDVVSRRRELKDGPKRLYERLVRWAGKNGECWWGFDAMGAELGKSDRQVRTDMAVLERYRLVAHRKRDGRKSNTYIFLWHEWFEERITAQKSMAPDQFEGKTATGQKGHDGFLTGSALPLKTAAGDSKLPVASGSPLPVKTDLSGSPLPPNRESIELRKGESSSSSCAHGSEPIDEATTTPPSNEGEEKTKTITPSEILPGSEQPTDWRTPETMRATVEALHYHRFRVSSGGGNYEYNKGIGARPDLVIVRRIQANFTSVQDQLDWFCDLEARNEGRRIRSYGFYDKDASTWQERRALVAEQRVLQEAAKLEAEREEARQREEHRQREEWARQRHETMLHRASIPDCPQCGRKGVVGAAEHDRPETFTWCTCEHAHFARGEHSGDYPGDLTRRAAVAWIESKAARLYEHQGERWVKHHARKRREGITKKFRDLDTEFACSNSDRREEILKELDAEILAESATLPESSTLPSPRPITQAEVDATAQTLRSKTMRVA
jgi:hypothetical protein